MGKGAGVFPALEQALNPHRPACSVPRGPVSPVCCVHATPLQTGLLSSPSALAPPWGDVVYLTLLKIVKKRM